MLVDAVKRCKLSICISTRNRAKFIGETLDSIVCQLTDECEIVVFDGASEDETTEVVKSRSKSCPSIKYYRQEQNDGLDHGFDHAVNKAQGEYCWFLPDDDVVKPTAITRILTAIGEGYCVIVANSELKTLDMNASWGLHGPSVKEDCAFGGNELDQFFEQARYLIGYIGSTTIKRDLWLSRPKDAWYGTYFIHVGVIFSKALPGPALVIADPLVSLRMENQSFVSKHFHIWYVNWPKVVESLALSCETKARVIDGLRAAMRPVPLCLSRAARQYSLLEYKQYIRPFLLNSPMLRWVAVLVSVLPEVVCYWIVVTNFSVRRRHLKSQMLHIMERGRQQT